MANYPQIIKASVIKIDQNIIVTLITNKNLKLLVIMINICLFLWQQLSRTWWNLRKDKT